MKLILAPLFFLMIFSLFSQLGITDSPVDNMYSDEFPDVDETFTATSDGYYDVNGHKVMDDHMNDVGEQGSEHGSGKAYYWLNETNFVAGYYTMADFKAAGDAVYNYPIFPLKSGDNLGNIAKNQYTLSFDSAGTYGVLAIVIAVMAIAIVAGLRVFGSGISEASVSSIIKATAFLSIWAFFSVLALPLITAIPIFGAIFYFLLTAFYSLGVFSTLGSPSGDGT